MKLKETIKQPQSKLDLKSKEPVVDNRQSIRDSSSKFEQNFGNKENVSMNTSNRNDYQNNQVEQKNNNFEQQQRQIEARNIIMSEPSGWKKIVDKSVLVAKDFGSNIYKNNANLKNMNLTGSPVIPIARNPFGAVKAASNAAKVVKAKTAVDKSSKIGTITTVTKTNMKTGVETVMRTNTVTEKATASMLTKLATGFKDPSLIVGGVMAMIGSYPFAGFIKEEALQTIGFGVKTALDNDDIESAEEALEFQKELLDPNLWSGIKEKVPFLNVLDSLDNFYESAQIKMSIDEKIIADKKIQIETGETETEKWTRIKQEEADTERANIDYYNEERKKMLAWEEEAADRDMKEDALFWRKEKEKQIKMEEAAQKRQAEFWREYKKQSIESSNATNSKLSFGIL